MYHVKHSWMITQTLSVTIERADCSEGHTFEAIVHKGPLSGSFDAALYSGEIACGDYTLTHREIELLEEVADEVADKLDELQEHEAFRRYKES